MDVTNPACARNAKQTIEFMRASVALLGKKDSPPVLLPLGIPHFFLHSLLFVVLFPEYLLTGDASGSSGKNKVLKLCDVVVLLWLVVHAVYLFHGRSTQGGSSYAKLT